MKVNAGAGHCQGKEGQKPEAGQVREKGKAAGNGKPAIGNGKAAEKGKAPEKAGHGKAGQAIKIGTWFGKHKVTLLMACVVVLILMVLGFMLWNFKIIGFCGDGRCDLRECGAGCGADCSPQMCMDAECQPAVGERCGNSQDCVCESSEVCMPDRNAGSEMGCYAVALGDGFCDAPLEGQGNACTDCGCGGTGLYCEGNVCIAHCDDGICAGGETKDNCCDDCGCDAGYECSGNVCERTAPQMAVSFTGLNTGRSAADLYARGGMDALVTVVIANNGGEEAKNINITLEFGDYAEETMTIPSLGIGEQKEIAWKPAYSNTVLEIGTERAVSAVAGVEYIDAFGNAGTAAGAVDVTVKGRNWMDWSGRYEAAFVTPLNDNVRGFAAQATQELATYASDADRDSAARKIFQELSAFGVRWTNDPTISDYVQLPEETLQRKSGDCDDLAMLYSSLLEAVGIDTQLIITESHIFIGYMTTDGHVVPVETTILESPDNYGAAKTAGADQYDGAIAIVSPKTQWDSGVKQLQMPAALDVDIPNISQPSAALDCQVPHEGEIECQMVGGGGGCVTAVSATVLYSGPGDPYVSVGFTNYDAAGAVMDSVVENGYLISPSTAFAANLPDPLCSAASCTATIASMSDCECGAVVSMNNSGGTGYRCLGLGDTDLGCMAVPNGETTRVVNVSNPHCGSGISGSAHYR